MESWFGLWGKIKEEIININAFLKKIIFFTWDANSIALRIKDLCNNRQKNIDKSTHSIVYIPNIIYLCCNKNKEHANNSRIHQ